MYTRKQACTTANLAQKWVPKLALGHEIGTFGMLLEPIHSVRAAQACFASSLLELLGGLLKKLAGNALAAQRFIDERVVNVDHAIADCGNVTSASTVPSGITYWTAWEWISN